MSLVIFRRWAILGRYKHHGGKAVKPPKKNKIKIVLRTVALCTMYDTAYIVLPT